MFSGRWKQQSTSPVLSSSNLGTPVTLINPNSGVNSLSDGQSMNIVIQAPSFETDTTFFMLEGDLLTKQKEPNLKRLFAVTPSFPKQVIDCGSVLPSGQYVLPQSSADNFALKLVDLEHSTYVPHFPSVWREETNKDKPRLKIKGTVVPKNFMENV